MTVSLTKGLETVTHAAKVAGYTLRASPDSVSCVLIGYRLVLFDEPAKKMPRPFSTSAHWVHFAFLRSMDKVAGFRASSAHFH